MKKYALSLVLSLMVTSAHAGAGRPSLLQCGIELAGTKMIYLSSAKSGKKEEKDKARRFESFRSESHAVTAAMRIQSKSTGRQMPRPFTVARFGCSW